MAVDALVVGLCSHGLSVSRSLARSGANVVAVEANATLPGTRTQTARVVQIASLDEDQLADSLIELAKREDLQRDKPWLFLTNDAMVRAVATQWERLANFYRLSWSRDTALVAALLDKASIAGFCEKAGVDFPRSETIDDIDSLQIAENLFPAAVKPAAPMGRFKVSLAQHGQDVVALAEAYPGALPFIVQEWIPGGQENLVFASGFAVDGKLMHAFSGFKLRSWPLDSGQGSVIVAKHDAAVIEAARQFVEATGLTGPIACEFKRRPDGRLALIEPNVGRTEYCTQLAASNGVDLVAAEYAYCSGTTRAERDQTDHKVWCDFERDSGSVWVGLRYILKDRNARALVTPFFDWSDNGPLFIALKQRFTRLLGKLRTKVVS
ncbi:MAG: hypothetical protein AAF290_06960 [Pseudomonadota bacterium]